MVSLDRELLDDELITELTPLLHAHKDEICLYEDFVLNPAWVTYKKMAEANVLVGFTAREEGKLIGYAMYTVLPNMHYMDVMHASQDVLYIDPSKRGRMTGIRLLKFADERLAELGVKLVSHHVKVNNDFSPLLERLGYKQAEKIYERRLA